MTETKQTYQQLEQELEVWRNGPSCWSCGDSGDVHQLDGEWLGKCNCLAAQLIDVTAERDQLKAENEKLRKALAESEVSASINYDCVEMISEHLIAGDLLLVGDEVGRLAAAKNVVDSVKAIQKDAERYRWLNHRPRWASTHVDFDRQGVYRQHRVCWYTGDDWPQVEGQSLDEAIDSAMSKQSADEKMGDQEGTIGHA